MCLIVVGWRAHADYPLVVFANRDEFHDRPTRRAEFWGDEPDLLAGRDRRGGGTWLGLTRRGRFAAISNVREPDAPEVEGRPSRGALVREFLLGSESPQAFAEATLAGGDAYAGFNLFVADRESMCWVSNRAPAVVSVEPGVYGVSNGGFDEPWPKVRRVKAALESSLEGGALSVEVGMQALASREVAPDDALPDTGVGVELERSLSPVFITSPRYGTRSSTVVLVKDNDQVSFVECVFDSSGHPAGSRGVAFSFDA